MKTKLFIGFIFNDQQLTIKKIKNFRARFDPKFFYNPLAHLGLVEPFEFPVEKVAALRDYLKEELDTFYFGKETAPNIEFKGIDFLQTKKRCLLRLVPCFDQEIEFLKELLVDICQAENPLIKIKNSAKFLTLGRFENVMDLNRAIESAKLEFDCEQAKANEIVLFRKVGSSWEIVESLMSFEESSASLYQPALMKL